MAHQYARKSVGDAHPTEMQIPAAVIPIFLFFACALGLVIALFVIASVFNPSKAGRVQAMPYESGMDPVHDTRRRFDVRFYLLAIAFLVFDVELLFLYPWAVALRPAAMDQPAATVGVSISPATAAAPVGIDAAVSAGLVESRHLVFGGVAAFFALLTVGFIYDWRKGIFRWR
jgi:NADH-quinone oxidoreductase subunit A